MNKKAVYSLYFLLILTVVLLLSGFLFDSSKKTLEKTAVSIHQATFFYKKSFCILASFRFSFLKQLEFKNCRGQKK